jgi:hypothetical protein
MGVIKSNKNADLYNFFGFTNNSPGVEQPAFITYNQDLSVNSNLKILRDFNGLGSNPSLSWDIDIKKMTTGSLVVPSGQRNLPDFQTGGYVFIELFFKALSTLI